MSKRWREGVPAGHEALRAARALALAGGLALLGVSGAAAQATPVGGGIAASPAAGECEAPEGMAGMDMAATPMATPAATPVTEEDGALPVGTPVADEGLVEDATAAAENFVNCWNEGNVDAVLALGTANFVQTQYGIESAEEAAEALGAEGALPPITIIETGDVQTYEDGRASLDLDYLLGEHQYTAARWYMVEADGQLLIDQQELTLPQPDVETITNIGLSFADDETGLAYDQGADEAGGRTLALLPGIVLTVNNSAGTESRFVSVVRLDEEPTGTPEAGPLPEGDFVAAFAVPAGDNADVALVNLTPGSYAIGEMDGESVPLTITEPEEVEV